MTRTWLPRDSSMWSARRDPACAARSRCRRTARTSGSRRPAAARCRPRSCRSPRSAAKAAPSSSAGASADERARAEPSRRRVQSQLLDRIIRSSPRATACRCPVRAGRALERRERRNVLELVVAEERPALEEPELAVREAELDVPRPRLAGRVVHRRERLGDLLAGGDDLLQLARARARCRCRTTARSALPPPGCSWLRHGDLNSVTSSTPCGDHSSVSADVPSTAPPTPSEVATSILPGVAGVGVGGHQHARLLRRHRLEDDDRRQHPERIVDQRLAPRERAELERRRPHLLQPVVDVVERLAVEDGQVEAGAVEVVEVLDVGVAAHEAADGLVRRRSAGRPPPSPSRIACLQLRRQRRLADRVADDLEARRDPRRELPLARLGRDHARRRTACRCARRRPAAARPASPIPARAACRARRPWRAGSGRSRRRTARRCRARRGRGRGA